MAHHRTRAEKQRASQLRFNTTPTYTLETKGDTASLRSTASQSETIPQLQPALPPEKVLKPLVRTEPKLIKRDILKTCVISLVLIALLLGMFAWTRYNGLTLPFLS